MFRVDQTPIGKVHYAIIWFRDQLWRVRAARGFVGSLQACAALRGGVRVFVLAGLRSSARGSRARAGIAGTPPSNPRLMGIQVLGAG